MEPLPPAEVARAESDAAGSSPAAVTRLRGGRIERVTAQIAAEVPIALEYNGISHAVMLATPRDLEDFALGFSLSEGLIHRASDLYDIEVQRSRDGITLAIDVSSAAFAQLKARRRTLAGRTGCGICGTESLDQVLRPIPPLAGRGPRVEAAALARANAALTDWQRLQRETGATHAAAWCSVHGDVLCVREDVGRHNALDKLIGALAHARHDVASGFALITSRASVEMVQKSATCGMALLVAVSAPTSLAVRVAAQCGQTLVGFARGADFSVYTYEGRIL
jgi:FdhD protein